MYTCKYPGGGTGATPNLLATAHPDYEVTVLARDQAKAAAVARKCPHFPTLIGDLDSTALMESARAASDMVLRFANANHIPAANAITHNLRGSYFVDPSTLGKLQGRVYGGIEDVAEITSFPGEERIHRDVDGAVIEEDGENVLE
ncbi:hypothetical protein C7212DRAFT_364231 [Tuber magnatum]|uniref:NmrA-like domain-containing protein n=1 Tax=Tuber magnatum TaxID=42249 RepID=A0A317SNJ3_9PEZI|nr:hypothetical protein C7212DRAFT_364231 [Tuber magnatum]